MIKPITLFLSAFFLSLNLFAQTKEDIEYVRNYINTEQGLSHNYVTSIISDDLNNKWIGTENGITKFNGYDFEYIKPSLGYKQLKNENIEVLFKDNSNNIWIGTKSGGLSFLDTRHNTIKNYNYLIDIQEQGDVRVTEISQDAKGKIWIGTWHHGVFVIDIEKDSLITHFKHFSPIFSIIPGENGDMWYTSEKTLNHYSTNIDSIERFNLGVFLTDLVYDKYRNKIWAATSGKSTVLYNYDYESRKIGSIETGVASNWAKVISIDKNNRLWIGTWERGLYRSNQDLTSFEQVNISPAGAGSYDQNYDIILSIHQDKSGQIWIGTANAGIVKLIPNKGFQNAADVVPQLSYLKNLNVTSIYKTHNEIFVGTFKKGLFIGSNFQNLKSVPDIPKTKIYTLFRHKDQLFVGSRYGFYIYDLNKKQTVFYTDLLQKVTCFYVDKKNNLYIGTQQKGMAIVPINKINSPDSYTLYTDSADNPKNLDSNRITEIKEDSFGNIWIGTYYGIHLFDPKSNQIFNQDQLLKENLPSVIINVLTINDKDIWVGTPSGLIRLNYDNKKKKLFIKDKLTIENGLRNDFICSITFDGNNKLWMTTNTEIIKYEPQKKSFVSYGKFEGVGTSSFNTRSFYNYNKDSIYFGGMDNITFFDSKSISTFNTVPEVVFSKLRVNNKRVEYDENNDIINQTFSYADKIRLDPDDRFFSVGFAVNDFLGKQNVRYRYRLAGYQDEWINLKNENEINFASLPAGNYKLMVAATRDNQNWSKPKELSIIVGRSFWVSIWAFLLYIIIISLTIYFFFRFKQNQLKLRSDLKIIKIEKEKEYALNESKLNFFTNISHEFRTPLTLILAPVKDLINSENISEKARKKLNGIERNTERLLHLINQLLDFRKAESGLLKLNASEGNFVRFSNEIYLYFKEIASDKKVRYKFKSEFEELRFPFDRNKMEIVLCNLLSNALKYTNPGDKITFKLSREDNFCVITISDTGIGMNPEDLDKIFDRFFQIKSGNTSRMVGSGIGLAFSKKIIELHHGNISVESKKNKGTQFCIKIDMDHEIYKDQIDNTFINTDNLKAYNIGVKNELATNLSINSKKYSVLIIDDNIELLDYMKEFLEKDYQVSLANSGEEGYEIASREIPDLIVSDVMMPGKDGITLCKELKSQISTSHIPILLLTARSSTVFEIEGLQTGADDYVTKPFNPAIIQARISSLLENRAKMREHLANKVRFEPTAKLEEEEKDFENNFIQKAMQLVEDNLHNSDFGIDVMIDHLNMSQSTLYRKIKSLTGLSLTGFIRSVRLKRAAYLILNTDLNLNEIAYEVGFNDYKYFKTTFKKQFECLPSKYRKKMLKTIG